MNRYFRGQSTIFMLKNFTDYKNQVIDFDRRWLNLIALITTDKSRKLFPQQVFGATGKDNTKEKGMSQYYFGSFPNPDFAMSIYREFSSEKTRRRVRTLDRLREVFFKALDRCEKKQRNPRDYQALEYESNTRLQLNPPRDPKFRYSKYKDLKPVGREYSKFKPRVQEMDMSDEESDNGGKPAADEVKEEKEEVDLREEKEEGLESEENDDDEEAVNWLSGMVIDPKGKRPPPCFEFANTGKCAYKYCRYSHNLNDIKEYLRLEAMSKVKFDEERK